MTRHLVLFLGILAVCPAAPAHSQSYTPEQVYSVLYDSIRQPFQMPLDDPHAKFYLSLSIVGSVVDAGDQDQVNSLANRCLPPSPIIQTFAAEPALDLTYERLIYGMIGPKREYPQAYTDARAYLLTSTKPPKKTDEYKAYVDAEKNYVSAFVSYITAKGPAERITAQLAMQQATNDWSLEGYRQEVAQRLAVIKGIEFLAGDIRTLRRQDVLAAYRASAIGQDSNPVYGAFKSPVSRFSPDPSKWADDDGWLGVSYSTQTNSSSYSKQQAERQGFGGFSIGFITIGGKAGDTKVEESHVTSVSKLSYAFQVKRIQIKRDWLDGEVLTEPASWTWRKAGGAGPYPLVATTRDDKGRPLESPAPVYDGKNIACPLLPLEIVIARNIRIEATMSDTDYKYVETSSKASGAGGLFGILGGGGSGSWSLTKKDEVDHQVSFVAETKGTSVIGYISQILPKLPNPDTSVPWPDSAWLPQ